MSMWDEYTRDVAGERVSTDQLREGDVVAESGMLLRLTDRRDHGPRMGNLPVFTFAGEVMNFPEVEDTWLRMMITDGKPGTPERPTWTVQGNELARWWRVQESGEPVGHDPECTGCEHRCPWKEHHFGAPYCSVCDDHNEAAGRDEEAEDE